MPLLRPQPPPDFAAIGHAEASVAPSAWAADSVAMLPAAIIARCLAERRPPITDADLFVTEACTLSCDYCFVAAKDPGSRMAWDVAQATVDFVLSSSGQSPEVSFHFMGGEPLLEFPLMVRTAEYASQRGARLGKAARFAVTTNGTILTEEIIAFGRRYGFNYLLSVDGGKEAHDKHRRTQSGNGSWEGVVQRALPLLRRCQGWVGARITVCPDTVGDLCSGVKTLYSLGVNQFLIGPDYDAAWTPAQLKTLFVQTIGVARFYADRSSAGDPMRVVEFEEGPAQRTQRMRDVWGCGAGFTRIAVSTTGAIYPCARFVKPFAGVPAIRLGDVWGGLHATAAWTRDVMAGHASRARCQQCGHAGVCCGGCPAANLHVSGAVGQPVLASCVFTAATHRALRLIHAPRPALGPTS